MTAGERREGDNKEGSGDHGGGRGSGKAQRLFENSRGLTPVAPPGHPVSRKYGKISENSKETQIGAAQFPVDRAVMTRFISHTPAYTPLLRRNDGRVREDSDES